MKIIKLLEARRNPALNTKQEFQQFIDGVFQKNGGSDNLFFSFQNLKKLGTNPKSPWETPSGVYAYPGDYIETRSKQVKHKPGQNKSEIPQGLVPFGGHSYFLYAFKFSGKLLDVSSKDGQAELFHLIKKGFDQSKINSTFSALMKWHDLRAETIDVAFAKLGLEEFGSILLKILYTLLGIGEIDEGWYVPPQISHGVNSVPAKISTWFLSHGIDGLIDNGLGVIYNTEPTQAVIYNPKSIKIVDMFITKRDQLDGNRAKDGKDDSNVKRAVKNVLMSYADSIKDLISGGDESAVSNYCAEYFNAVLGKLQKSNVDANRAIKVLRASLKHIMNDVVLPFETSHHPVETVQLKNFKKKYDELDDFTMMFTDLINTIFSSSMSKIFIEHQKIEDSEVRGEKLNESVKNLLKQEVHNFDEFYESIIKNVITYVATVMQHEVPSKRNMERQLKNFVFRYGLSYF